MTDVNADKPVEPTVELTTATANPEKQKALVEVSTPRFSHDEELPLKISVAKSKWWGRARLIVRTMEDVWYEDAALRVRVAKDSVSDLGSIPAMLWWIISPWDIALESIFHDELYKSQIVRRYVADAALRSMMEERGKPPWVCFIVWAGVRMGGGRAWRRHTEELKVAADVTKQQ
jgi:hypothetical protein